MRKLVGFIFLLQIVISNQVFGQASSCAQVLRLVQTTYEQGRLHELEGLMAGCLGKTQQKEQFDEQQMVSAYRYLTLAYIYLEEPEKADDAMLSLLNSGQAGHFFEPNDAVDPAEFIALYRKFRVKPLFRAGFKIGPTATMPAFIQTQYVNSDAQGNGKFNPRVGFSAVFVFEKDFDDFIKNFSIAPEIGYSARSYNYTNDKLSASDQNPDSTIISQDQNLHKQSWIDLNLLVQYKLKESALNPYLSLGPGINYLLQSSNEIQTPIAGNGAITGSAIDTKSSYNPLVYSVILSAGIKYRFGGFYLTGDIRYQYGLSNLVNPSTRSNSEALFDYGYVPSDYRQNNVTINLGVVIPYFSPKKLIK